MPTSDWFNPNFALQHETFEPRLNVRDASLELLQSTPLPGAFALFDWGGSLHAVFLESGLVFARHRSVPLPNVCSTVSLPGNTPAAAAPG